MQDRCSPMAGPSDSWFGSVQGCREERLGSGAEERRCRVPALRFGEWGEAVPGGFCTLCNSAHTGSLGG